MNKKYWQSFGELNQTDAFRKETENEFKEELLPVEELSKEGLLEGKTPRRDFLKYLGFSTAAAALAASCEMPVKKAIPYVQKPDNLIPGVPNYYASTYINGGDAISVVVKQRDGRPIKIEGNEMSGLTKGGTSARAQASVLDLYDTIRLRHPLQRDGKGFKEVSTFEAFDKMVGDALASLGGKQVVLLTSTINSPSTLQLINEFLAKYPGSRHVQYDGVSYSGMLLANEACYGKRALPSYHFDKAKTIVSLSADFLGTWLSPVEFSSQYAETRRVKGKNPNISRHIQFESMLSLTGSNADDRFTHKPSETGAIALALLAKLGGGVSAPAISDARLAKGIDQAAAALMASKGESLVVCGSNDMNIQVVVNAINEVIGANGNTINWAVTSNYRKGIDADLEKLSADISAGTVGAVLLYDCNPVYTHANGKKFGDLLAGLPVTVSFSPTLNETAERCKYIIPHHHWLESWGDAEPKSGYFSMIQPLINPLFKTRAFQDSLLKWSGNASDYHNYLKSFWVTKLGSEDLWNKALQDGVVEAAVAAAPAVFNAGAVTASASALSSAKSGNIEVVLYEKVSMGDGSQANNPWLQELPDPVSKVTWDNYAMISPELAKTLLGIDVYNNQKQADTYEVTPEKPVIKVTVAGKSIELPALILPGLNPSTIAIALGYGRESANPEHSKDRVGRSATGAGKNAFPMAVFNGSTVVYNAVASAEKTGNVYPLAQTQVHGSSEGRPVIYETSLSDYSKEPGNVLKHPREERELLLVDGKTDFVKDATIYPDHVKPGIKWGMSIDLNTCTGCSACVVACTAENNVSVVGKIQVQRAHEMHWLRIDRYFTGDKQNPDVVFQPMLCQHCDNAPCENVCPVAATNHSSEGLNQMTYNRCIGTRYCANNCPYKVRRFNWLDYTGSDSFADNQEPLRGTDLDDSVFQMNEDLTRMVLNPDVTVRARGVIEKCSFCVQRLQESKLESKKNQDPSIVRNVKTACMQACPTHAISFGNVNDKESDVYKIRNVDQKDRTFYVLEQLHVLPNVSYLAKIRNTDRQLGHHDEEHHEEKKGAPAKAHA
ncbi:MAG TPA: TAT-variant-translocated molybdopterin oxidoreductase [Ferruginibacter sp.]|nr:TAT-variant-translocated molybdopterin oxidoreductase [Ferruginibacter sp.]